MSYTGICFRGTWWVEASGHCKTKWQPKTLTSNPPLQKETRSCLWVHDDKKIYSLWAEPNMPSSFNYSWSLVQFEKTISSSDPRNLLQYHGKMESNDVSLEMCMDIQEKHLEQLLEENFFKGFLLIWCVSISVLYNVVFEMTNQMSTVFIYNANLILTTLKCPR